MDIPPIRNTASTILIFSVKKKGGAMERIQWPRLFSLIFRYIVQQYTYLSYETDMFEPF
jgi:hypothetical protein